jgi:hypothetical protein
MAAPAFAGSGDRHKPRPNPVIDWAAIVQPAIHNAAAPRSAGTSQVLHTYAMLAVYDAVVAIEGKYEPYAGHIDAPRGADIRAAVATAAYLTVRAKAAPSQYDYLDDQYTTYLAAIPEGPRKSAGVQVGEQASAALLALRAGDGFDDVVPYFCSMVPPPVGEFVPNTGCPTLPTDPQPVDVKLGKIRPFTYDDPGRFRPSGPNEPTSDAYAEDFVETRDYGRVDSALRTPAQTEVAYFWSEHPYVFWNRNLVALAVRNNLGVREAARYFALVYTTTSDAVIAGFEAKYHYTYWRPRTAIPAADDDGNPETPADAAWTPLLQVNHPEYPSGHGFWSGALTDAVGRYFGTRSVRWTLEASVPQVAQKQRSYRDLDEVMREVVNARIWAGLHWRQSMRHGEQIGRAVARHVSKHYFERCDGRRDRCR